MNYFLIKLAFDTAVHFGPADTAQSLAVSEDHVCADTLFSALCHTAMQVEGENLLKRLCGWVQDGTLLLSDTMPWRGEDFFLPKPCVLSDSPQDLPPEWRKAMKKLAWLPVRSFSAFSESVRGGAPFDPSSCPKTFGIRAEITRAAVSEGEDAVPYRVGVYRFDADCGLYFLAAMETAEQETVLLTLVEALGLSGIGGKISSGYGKFHLEGEMLLNEFDDEQTRWLYHGLACAGKRALLLSASLPGEDEMETALEGAAFQVIRRGGFAASDSGAENPMKKKTQYFIRAGSLFVNRYAGGLYVVNRYGCHPVYRYGKPLFLGVNL